MKKNSFLLLLLVASFAVLLLPKAVASSSGEDLLGGLGTDALTTINNLLKFRLDLPGYTSLGIDGAQGIPLWVFLSVFVIIYTVIFLALSKVAIFNKESARGARISFAVALSFIIELGTSFIPRFWKIINTLVKLIALLAIVFMFWNFWLLIRKHYAYHLSVEETVLKEEAKYNKNKEEYNKDIWKAQQSQRLINLEKKKLEEIEEDLNKLNISDLTSRITQLKEIIVKLKAVINSKPSKAHEYIKRINKVLATFVEDIQRDFGKSAVGLDELKQLFNAFKQEFRQLQEMMNTLPKKDQQQLEPILRSAFSVMKNYTLVNKKYFPNNKNILKVQEERINMLIKNIEDAFNTTNLDGVIANLNEIEQLLNYTEKIKVESEREIKDLKQQELVLRSAIAGFKNILRKDEKQENSSSSGNNGKGNSRKSC